MSEQNIVNVMVIPDVPKVLPGEQLYVYVPKASFTSPGIIAYNNTQFRIDGNFLFIREDYVSPGVQQKIDELKQYTDDKLQLKQDKEDNNISLAQRPEQKSVVGAINDLGTLTGQAQDTADDAIRKIGDLSTLTTDEKTTIVDAINEVDAHADANKAEIGNLSALTTDEKATLVGAINEVDAHTNTAQQAADAAQATADNATNLANTGISKADRAQTTANTAVDKANDAKATAQEAIMKADGRSNSIGFMTAKDAVTALNSYPRTQLKGGDTIWIVETGTPDLWVTEVAQESVPYNYTTKDKFNQDLVDNKVLQIGYFKTAYQESDGKPVTIAWQNVLVKSTDWVASTEFADFPYEAKIELTDFVDYTTVPQVVFDIADTMSGNYAPICKSGDKCVYIYGKVQNEITLKTVITFAPNVNGASVTGGGYTNKGKWVASTTYEIDDLVYTDNGQFVCIEGITSTTSPEQDTQHWQATFVANVPVKSVNGQTGAVTIEVPTKTSELENDSGYVRSVPPVVQDVVCNDVDSAATLDTTITCEIGDLILAQIIVRSALTLPTDWTLLRTIPAVETKFNQTLSFAYKRATSTSETLTVTQATAGRIYTNLVRLSNAASISYIQSCEKTGTDIASISSTKPVTPNMVIWGASNTMWNNPSPYGDWTYAPSTLDYYSVPQTTRAPRLGTFIDSSGAGERTFTPSISNANGNATMCGAVEVVGDEVARKGDIPTKTSELTNDSGFLTTADIPTKTSELENDSGFVKASEANTFTGEQTFSNANGIKANKVNNLNGGTWYDFDGTNDKFGNTTTPTIIRTSEARPKAEVPSGSATVTKELALLEDVQGDAEWSDIVQNATVSPGLYYVLMDADIQPAGHASIVFYDGTHWAHGIPCVNCGVVDGMFSILTFTPHIDPGYNKMTATYAKITCENGVWTQVKMDEPSKFKYRKIK